ncbi:MAG: LD-carboxypeptidase [Paludibacteraceae bacterium]|nr:LD-carboxypeptidase [Paludibacteraceae bacterium]
MNNKKANIIIVSPSGAIDPTYIDGAQRVLTQWGYNVSVSPNAKGKYGRFSATDRKRISDLQQAINNPTFNIILCARGGYGLSRIIDKIDFSPLIGTDRLIVGFSDITAIHNALGNLGVKSIHAPMAKHIATECDSPAVWELKKCLEGKTLHYTFKNMELNRKGKATGRLIGGNLSMIYALRGTKFDLNYDGAILFIEDVGERLYHIDRMMQNLRLGGVFNKIKGLIVGQFTLCDVDDSFPDGAYGVIANAVKGYRFPVALNFSSGHIDNNNMPLMLGANYTLNVPELPNKVILDQIAD